MFWADQIVEQIIASGQFTPYWVDDMKTPSGRVHVGALRGVMIHDFIFKALQKKGRQVKYTYVFNDMDPMDALPGYLDKAKYEPHMGKPFFQIPAPDGEEPYSRYFANEFIQAFNSIGANPEILWSSELYQSGKMDQVIKIALDNVDKIRQVYKEIGHYDLPADWAPFQPICEQCGKVGTTTAYGWDGRHLHYRCEENKVAWAKGCGHQGIVSPFGGTGKLLWKVDWPAHWTTIGVTIEGAGKDHTSAGGSRDMAKALLAEVFNYPNPFDIPYEWFVIRGAKMSSSKGVGTSAKDFVAMFPPEIARFLFARVHCNKVLDFDPAGNTIPDLFDEYDRCAGSFFACAQDDFAYFYEISQIADFDPAPVFLPRFRSVANYLGQPSVDLKAKFASEKGSQLNSRELEILEERIKFAKIWLAKYAPVNLVNEISDEISPEALNLAEAQKQYLGKVIDILSDYKGNAQDLQQTLYEAAKADNLPAKKAFEAIYLSLLGKKFGPKAGWLILDQGKEKVVERMREATNKKLQATSNE